MVENFLKVASFLKTAETAAPAIQIQETCPPSRALLTCFLARQLSRPVLCIASDDKGADRFAGELNFFFSLFNFPKGSEGPERNIISFPAGLAKPVGLTRSSLAAGQERLSSLLSLIDRKAPPVVVTSLEAIMEKVPPQEALRDNIKIINQGEQIDRDALAGFLFEVGYKKMPVVEAPGEYAVRGSLIDLYPLTGSVPYRVDFFGDIIDGIRAFSPDTQRSSESVSSITIPPAGFYITRAIDTSGLAQRVKQRADALDIPPRNRMEFLARIETGLPPHEFPLFLPFFYSELSTLLDYMGPDPLVMLLDPGKFKKVEENLIHEGRRSLAQMEEKETIVPDIMDILCKIYEKFAKKDNIIENISFSELPLTGPSTGSEVIKLSSQSFSSFLRHSSDSEPPKGLSAFLEPIRQWIDQGQRVFLICGSDPEKVRLSHLLLDYDQPFIQPEEKLPLAAGPAGLYLVKGDLSQGFVLPEGGLIFIHEEDIFGPKIRKHRLQAPEPSENFSLKELKQGNHIVHIDFGIGLFKGLETLNIRNHVNDYLHLEYAGGDKLFLPVDRTSRIQKYISTEDLPPSLDKLGSTSWARIKQKVKESILEMAEELVSLYALRLVKKGHSYSKSDPSFQEFEATFPYEETPDQMQAIEQVIQDMESPRPMDRLVCGDVGFGKTEVAIRAAYKAVMDGKQVAVLVPTTVLAQQHYSNFQKRFEAYPVEVQMLSRFRSPKQQRAILAAMADGKIDIIIGTHRLVQKDVRFRELGLLILDEEHRFGVKQKEALKKLRAQVDVLTLSATPIPRTLQMSMLGLKDLSTIKTPPQDRRAIETFIVPFHPEIIRHAVLQEIDRGGQIFFVHNRVYDIDAIADRVKRIVPQARLGVAHGQMSERALEDVMIKFVQKDFDILVCTTIIESGLDIPNANTLLVHRADRLGLAQLYQLRGRVRRSERQAYTYFIVPEENNLSGDAQKRLEALYEFSDLASGFRIARYDLEIRGAGNLLGASQSGEIRAVGYDLYMDFLEKAIRKLKGEEVIEEVDPEIHLDVPAFLPQDFIEDSTQRLSFYKQLANTKKKEEVEQIRAEMLDRFGPLPEQAERMLELIHIKVRLRRLRIKEARLAEEGLMLSFAPHTPVQVERILEWIARDPQRFQLYPDDRLLIRFAAADQKKRLTNIQELLVWLEQRCTGKKVANDN